MIQFLITLLVLVASSQATVHYVGPDNSFSSCPGQPCLTLHQYASQQTKYFTSGSTFKFLAGNHTSYSSVLLYGTSNVELKAMDSSFDVIVLCKTAGAIQLIETTNVTIQGITFVLEAVNSSSTIKVIYSTDILFINSVFLGNSGAQVRAVYCDRSDIAIARSKFEGNSGDYGGAVYAEYCKLTINCSIFNRNIGDHGGAVFAEYCNATINHSSFNINTAEHYGGAIVIVKSNLIIDNSILTENIGDTGGAVYAEYCNLTINNSVLKQNLAGDFGGAIAMLDSNLIIDSSVFNGNTGDTGGAVYTQHCIFTINNNNFNGNTAEYTGGAIAVAESKLTIDGSVFNTRAGNLSDFYKNKALFGGAMHIFNSSLVQVAPPIFSSNSNHLYFTDNVAKYGSGVYSWRSNLSLFSAIFNNNTCFDEGYGGAIISFYSTILLHDFNATENCRALAILLSTVSFSGNVTISRNYGNTCGSISTTQSSTSFTGHTVFEGNHVSGYGGAVCTQLRSTLSLSGTVLFTGNHAGTSGGAINAYATTTIFLGDNVNFVANSAKESGGAIFFESGTRLSLKQNLMLTLKKNHAGRYGGALYYDDAPTLQQCSGNWHSKISCFIDFFRQTSFSFPYVISARNNSATKEGGYLFGGLLDKCNVFITARITHYTVWHLIKFYPIFLNMTAEQSDATLTQEITSQPYHLCFCNEIQEHNCTEENIYVTIQRGRKFTVPLMALGQGDTVVSSPVRARIRSTARLLPEQRLQHLPRSCTSLNFNMYSSQKQELLILYLDESPCLDTGLSRMVINMTFLPCPDGFTLSGDHCVCEERLQKYHAYCTICDDGVFITKKAGSTTFWLNPLNSSNKTYLGLILYPTCPTQYCKTDSVNISLDNPDIQCAQNRSRVLCGACAINYSLTFGSSRCEICSNTHLALFLAFAATGIVLVVFLTLLRLTVATGLINSVILYANIVQTNKDVLFPNSSPILKVFIAWMNFDFGFQTCFYDGMDAYAQTWLQFAFPVYVWIIISLIIITSRYSMTVTKLIGSNPIAVLATLLLMSYTKVLKIIIEVYSSVDLEYPGNKTVTVWLKDANEPYLQSRHLVLTVVATLFLVFLFLPYTLLLLLGYKLYHFTGRKHTHWLMRIKPLLDAYYAPNKMHTRFWTGFLLLVRCALYIMFSYNSLRHTSHSLLAIIITFAAIFVWLTVKIYSKLLRNTLEGIVYFNLIVLSAVALAGVGSPVIVDCLIGMVFVIMIGVIIYHFHILYIAKSALWLKLLAKMTIKPIEATPLLTPVDGASQQEPLAAIATSLQRTPTRSVLSIQT